VKDNLKKPGQFDPSFRMKANEFAAWRARVGLTQRQIADRLGVTRQTIQNRESAVSPIPQAVDMSCVAGTGAGGGGARQFICPGRQCRFESQLKLAA
jgi:hypothetical protein